VQLSEASARFYIVVHVGRLNKCEKPLTAGRAAKDANRSSTSRPQKRSGLPLQTSCSQSPTR
jgi:hypothetical protein